MVSSEFFFSVRLRADADAVGVLEVFKEICYSPLKLFTFFGQSSMKGVVDREKKSIRVKMRPRALNFKFLRSFTFLGSTLWVYSLLKAFSKSMNSKWIRDLNFAHGFTII